MIWSGLGLRGDDASDGPLLTSLDEDLHLGI